MAVFLLLERLTPRRRQPFARRGLVTDVLFLLGQALLFSGGVVVVLWQVHGAVAGLVPRVDWPLWLKALVALLLGDLAVYWVHRASHHVPLLWRFHSVHHSSEQLDVVAAFREHPVDGLLTQLIINLPAMLLDVPLGGLTGLIAFRGLWALFIHSNVKLPVGPLRFLLGAPSLHHWHHAKTPGRVTNFGNLSAWTDLLFGTFHDPRADETWELGVPEKVPSTWWGLIGRPMLENANALVVVLGLSVVTAMSALAAPDGGVEPTEPPLEFLPATKAPGHFFAPTPRPQPVERSLDLEAPTIAGSLSAAEISAVVKKHLPALRACSETDAGVLLGRVDVRFTIDPTGATRNPKLWNSTASPAQSSCTLRVVSGFVFPKPRGGGTITVTYPFIYR